MGLQGLQGFHPFCFTRLGAVLDSDYPEDKYELRACFIIPAQKGRAEIETQWGPGILLIRYPHPTAIALRLLLGTPKGTLILPIFRVITPALQQNLWENTRIVALNLFNRHRH